MEEPTPTKVAMSLSMFKNRRPKYAMKRATEMVERMIGKDCFPVCNTTPRFRPKPSNTTADCKIFLEVNVNPTFNRSLSFTRGTNIIPINKAKMAPPTRGKRCPNHWLARAIPPQIPIPGMYLPIMTFMYCLLCIPPNYTLFFNIWSSFYKKKSYMIKII